MKTIEEQIEDIIIAWFKSGNENSTYLAHQIFEVCKRYAIEVAKASLKKASEKALMRNEGHGNRYYTTGDPIDIESIECGIISIDKSSITDEQNIVL